MSAAVNLTLALIEGAVVLALPPLLMSVIAKTKAWFGGRVGPPWLQPYYDLHKLIRKTSVYSRTTTWLFRAGPIVNLSALLTIAALLPVLSNRTLLGFPGDVILGASREVTFGAMSEPALFLTFVVLAVVTRDLQLSHMLGPAIVAEWRVSGPAMVLIVVALFVVLLAETCRVPVDDPATHLELTMIHEVMVLDHSGPEFAYISYGAALKFTLLGSILVHVAVPHPEGIFLFDPVLRLCELITLAAVVGVIESVMARLRLNRVPLLLAGSAVLSALAVVIVLGRKM
jgi:formate hydrogenlyase subunit 4